jgi:hypothetical protein
VAPGDGATAVYHWAPLTSGSRWFALWPLQLPFTIINVAGYMRPRRAPIRGWVAERLVQVLALATTSAWVGWSSMVGQVVLRDHDHRAGLSLSAALVLAPFLVSQVTRRAFDAVEPRSDAGRGDAVRTDGTGLRDPGFFNGKRHQAATWLHGAVALATFIWVLREGESEAALVVAAAGHVVVGAGTVQMILVLAIAAVTFQRGRRWWNGSPAAAAAGLGVLLLGGLMTAVIQWSVGSCPAGVVTDDAPDACGVLRGRPWMLVDVFGWALLVGLGMAVVVVVNALLQPRLGAREPPMVRLLPSRLARVRARIALLPTRLAPVVAVTVATHLMVGSVVFAARAWPVGTAEVCDGLPLIEDVGPCQLADERLGSAGGVEPWVLTDTPPVTVARWAFLGLLGFMGLNLVKSRAAPHVLRRVGQIWDVLTFWPRRFHPLAVRPYGERAVPELQQLLVQRPDVLGHDELVVTAHSQGSVLVAAALAPYRAVDRLCLLTMGSPLRSLYAEAFPHYVDDDLFHDVCVTVGSAGRWRNTFRFTDHVGRSVFVVDEPWTDHDDEVPLPDPRSRGAPIAGHNDYWADPAVLNVLREWQEAEARRAADA